MNETSDVAPKTSALSSDEQQLIQDQDKRTRRILRWGALILTAVLLTVGVTLLLTQNRATSADDRANTSAEAAKSVADPVLVLCAEGGAVALKLNQAGLCGTAASVSVIAGQAGATGATGETGPAGVAGPAGPAGPMGPTGAAGAVGATGAMGATGATGPSGAQGETGASGATGPAGPAGPPGDKGDKGDPGTPATLPPAYTKTYPDGTVESCTKTIPETDPPNYDCTRSVI